jgi:hypothetical protein
MSQLVKHLLTCPVWQATLEPRQDHACASHEMPCYLVTNLEQHCASLSRRLATLIMITSQQEDLRGP